jgi:very-short-patch-repair endonuclease
MGPSFSPWEKGGTRKERAVRAKLTGVVRVLRGNQTDAERKLWGSLRNRQLEGLKFRRQYVIGPFVADFCCEEYRLIIELDGGQHADQVEQDRMRTVELEDMKYHVLRFWNFEIFTNMDGVIDTILSTIRSTDRFS